MPTVHITFTGLCNFRNDTSADPQTGGVVVDLPRASMMQHFCGEHLRPHVAELITRASHLGGSNGHYVGLSLEGGSLDVDAAAAGGPLSAPGDLAAVTEFGGKSGSPLANRIEATIRLRGGSFVQSQPCRRAPSCTSGPWNGGRDFRWQANWKGEITAPDLTVQTAAGNIRLVPERGSGELRLTIVNVMPMDLRAWMAPDSVGLMPSGATEDVDFRWFFWLYGWENDCTAQAIPQREATSGTAPAGLPYTCLMGRGEP